MSIYLIKIVEFGLRSVLIITLLFALHGEEASTLGFLFSFLSIASFVVGYERYIDVQRTIAASGPSSQVVFSKHYTLVLIHWAIAIIPLSGIVAAISSASNALSLAATVIIISDHLSTEYYRLTTITSEDRIITILSFSKYSLLILALLPLLALGESPSLNSVLFVWASLSAIQIVHAIRYAIKKRYLTRLSITDVTRQYVQSGTHFLIGLSAILSLQVDRLLTNWLLSSEASQYYQHAFIAAGIYHVYSIGVLHPRLKHIYSGSLRYSFEQYTKLILLPCIISSVSISTFVYGLSILAQVAAPSDMLQLSTTILVILTLSYVLRSQADVVSFYLNAILKERLTFYAHTSAITFFILATMVTKPTNLVDYALVGLCSSIVLFISSLSLAIYVNSCSRNQSN